MSNCRYLIICFPNKLVNRFWLIIRTFESPDWSKNLKVTEKSKQPVRNSLSAICILEKNMKMAVIYTAPHFRPTYGATSYSEIRDTILCEKICLSL